MIVKIREIVLFTRATPGSILVQSNRSCPCFMVLKDIYVIMPYHFLGDQVGIQNTATLCTLGLAKIFGGKVRNPTVEIG